MEDLKPITILPAFLEVESLMREYHDEDTCPGFFLDDAGMETERKVMCPVCEADQEAHVRDRSDD